MHLTSALVLGFAALVNASASTYSQQLCATQYGASSISQVGTTTSGRTFTFTTITSSTYTPTVTTTPQVSTTTSTAFTTTTFTTTLPTTTTTISTTTTAFTTTISTVSYTSTTTSTITTTSTAPVGTTTIGTSAGFTPIQSQVAAKGYTVAKRNALAVPENPLIAAAQIGARAARTTCHISIGHDGKQTASPAHYPTQVACRALVEVVTTSTKVSTASKTITQTATTPVTTVTSVSTISVTSTVTPTVVSVTALVTTTSTVSTTTAVTSTSTVSTTTTMTSVPPQATVYAICQQNNYLTTVNGGLIDAFDEYGSYSGLDGVNSIDECCNICASMGSSCAAGIYFPSSAFCYFAAQGDGSCNAQQSAAKFYINQYTDGSSYTILNTNCGNFAGPGS